MKFKHLWFIYSFIACASLTALNDVETKAFDRLVYLAGTDRDSFCAKGYSSFVETIRSHEGEACNNVIGAALAVMTCKDHGDFNKSKCFGKARALGIIGYNSAENKLKSIKLESGQNTFKALCETVNKILPDVEQDCNGIISYVTYPNQFPLKPIQENKAIDAFFPSQDLRVVKELKDRLANEAAVVIFGAPGSGKTEQMELGLQNKPYLLFDLRSKFLDAHYDKNNITDKTAKENIKKNYEKMKDEENKWLNANRDQIVSDIIADKNSIIVFDEFDMAEHFEPGDAANKTAVAMIEMAKQVKDAGKKIVFIIHEEGLNSGEVADAMKKHFGIKPLKDQVIRTGYITEGEENMLLNKSEMTQAQKDEYKNLMKGHPSGYLELIKKMAGKWKGKAGDLSFDNLKAKTKETIVKVYNVMKKIQKGLIPIFTNLAKGVKGTGAGKEETIINTGFTNEYLRMSPIVKEVILEQK